MENVFVVSLTPLLPPPPPPISVPHHFHINGTYLTKPLLKGLNKTKSFTMFWKNCASWVFMSHKIWKISYDDTMQSAWIRLLSCLYLSFKISSNVNLLMLPSLLLYYVSALSFLDFCPWIKILVFYKDFDLE